MKDWTIEVRKRLKGKLAGGVYKVFISPTGVKHYSLSSAINGGFAPDHTMDGRKGRRKGKAAAGGA